jgi:hypothetical protein
MSNSVRFTRNKIFITTKGSPHCSVGFSSQQNTAKKHLEGETFEEFSRSGWLMYMPEKDLVDYQSRTIPRDCGRYHSLPSSFQSWKRRKLSEHQTSKDFCNYFLSALNCRCDACRPHFEFLAVMYYNLHL